MSNLPQVYRCEWRDGRVWFHRRDIQTGERCPDGWFASDKLAAASMARRLRGMADDMLKAAEDITRDRRGE